MTNKHLSSTLTSIALLAAAVGCGPTTEDEVDPGITVDAGAVIGQVSSDSGSRASGGNDASTGSALDSSTSGGSSSARDAQSDGRSSDAGQDAGSSRSRDASAPSNDAASAPDAAAQAGSDAGTPPSNDAGATCDLPTTFRWTGGAPLAQPKNGSVSMKDVSHAFHNGQHVLYFTTFQNNWGSGMMTFEDWPEAASAPQTPTSFGVAPTLFFFTPKNIWVLAYQWGPHKFSYRTSSDPANANGWSAAKSLYNTALPPDGTGPIDQTVICDSAKCYLYYAGDNGHIYKSSMSVANFPGEFPAAQDSGIVGTAQNLFEAVQVYKLKGSNKYLMIVEAQGGARYFRAWTASSLDGPWTLLTNEFAIKKNVTLSTNWTNDISHGDIIRTGPDETFTIDPCNIQFLFQGRDPNINTDYGRLPYRLGLLTLQR
ncbi:MAG TPA: non-reducing end alpha-L-arabinofuranosidase family hydrolase [Polyangiales bacterium]|nr:non-reducing end alpha-L-arabinofuranosidase family hydrolase [Polyangiales bacterium]